MTMLNDDTSQGWRPGPLLEASALPAACYTSDRFFAAETEAIHRRNWFFVGLASELARSGAYRAIETVGGPVIVLRDGSGALSAFANVCRHRGSILLEGSGEVRAITCPYHGWTYRLDGTLAAAPAMKQKLGCYRFDRMVCTWRQEIDCRCNWKLLVENALESYHTGLVHARTVGAQTSVTLATKGQWIALQVLSQTSVAVLTDRPPLPPIEGLTDQARLGTYFTMVLPATQFACAQDCMWWLTMRPLAPDRTMLSLGGCFPRSTAERPDFAEAARLYYDRWARVAAEDVGILERQQRGLASILYRPGRLSWRDDLVHAVHEWVAARVPAAMTGIGAQAEHGAPPSAGAR